VKAAHFDDVDAQYRDGANLRARIALHTRFGTNPQGWAEWVLGWLARLLPPRARILDAGCGTAQLWVANEARVPAGWRVVLCDRSHGMLADARRALGDAGRLVAVADVQALSFANASFDAVVANHMLYHVPDRARALACVSAALAPGGVLLAATNGSVHLRELEDALRAAGAPEAELGSGVIERFTLENGAAQLAPHFTRVELHRYEDHLLVTEVEPLLAYVGSLGVASETLARLRAGWSREIAQRGAIRIGKDTGLFVARSPS
jgi:SAM-dependent methyltransferase